MSSYQALRFRITSASPLLMHNGQLADPLNGHAKAMAQLAGKRKRTDADHLRLAELELRGSLYLSCGRPCIPAEMMEAALVKAAAQERRGQKVKSGLLIREALVLEYDGPKDPEQLCADPRFRLRCGVRVGPGRIMRTRPRFDEWQADLTVDYLPHVLNRQDVAGYVAVAGAQIGIGDWRPRFGRFTAEPLAELAAAA